MTPTSPAPERAEQIMWLVTAGTSASRRTRSPPATARFPLGRLEAARSLIFADAVAGALWLRPEGGEGQLGAQTPELNAFTSTEVPRATSTVETISGPKSPCSTTPAVPANCAARAAGSENATV